LCFAKTAQFLQTSKTFGKLFCWKQFSQHGIPGLHLVGQLFRFLHLTSSQQEKAGTFIISRSIN
jgi:hypothetical protein